MTGPPTSDSSPPTGPEVTEPAPAEPGGEQAPPPKPSRGRPIPWRLVALGALLVYGILFVILNSKEVPVSFVFFTPRVSLIVALVLALLIGFLAGYLFDTMRDRTRSGRKGKAEPPKA